MPVAPGSIPPPMPPPYLETRPSLSRDSRGLVLRVPEAATQKTVEVNQPTALGAAQHDHEVPIKACLVPREIYEHIVEAGVVKSKWPLDKQIVMGLLAGFYIGFSFTTMMVVGGLIPSIQTNNPGIYNLILGGFGFPLGLFMICVVGADLFTSNCAYFMVALHEGRVPFLALVKSWVYSWWINFAGCIIMAEIVHAAWIFHGREEFCLWLAHKKTSYPFGATFCKAVLANWLVNLAVWIANASQDITGKAVGIWLPISAFIAMGGEHCIANQFVFSLGKLLGSDVSVGTMIVKNLIPATLGNIVGGAFFVGTMYSYALGSMFPTTYRFLQLGAAAVLRMLPPRCTRTLAGLKRGGNGGGSSSAATPVAAAGAKFVGSLTQLLPMHMTKSAGGAADNGSTTVGNGHVNGAPSVHRVASPFAAAAAADPQIPAITLVVDDADGAEPTLPVPPPATDPARPPASHSATALGGVACCQATGTSQLSSDSSLSSPSKGNTCFANDFVPQPVPFAGSSDIEEGVTTPKQPLGLGSHVRGSKLPHAPGVGVLGA